MRYRYAYALGSENAKAEDIVSAKSATLTPKAGIVGSMECAISFNVWGLGVKVLRRNGGRDVSA